MVTETLMALASAAGAAAAHAFGTDAWAAMRVRVAEVFGRGDVTRTEAALRRLDRSVLTLNSDTDPADIERASALLAASLCAQFQTLLESVDEGDRVLVVDLLHEMLSGQSRTDGGVSAGEAGIAVSGDIKVRSEGRGSFTAGVVQGGVHVTLPPQPGPEQLGR
ncbi:hypothetical protein ACFYXF_17775 [Streptomyces sp. NPDC002680]|uniref:hypothetical protein n=1 Tax=Streptomyces sp. NPDC002680 TaxID=3364659 RepID=UPI0036D02C51